MHEMTIETGSKMTKPQATEVTNVLLQAGKVISNPQTKITDFFKWSIISFICCGTAAVMFTIMIIQGKGDFLSYVCVIVSVLALLAGLFMFRVASRMRRTYMSGDRKVTIVLDDDGVDYDNHFDKKLKIGWNGFKFIREMKECLYMFPNDMTGIIIIVNREHTDGVAQFFREHNIDKQFIRNDK